MKGASRLDAVVATLVGILALCVSAYTAYIQKQQVRAQVLPLLEFGTGNVPSLRLFVSNKGVGPAIIRHVVISVDGKPERNWKGVLRDILGDGEHNYYQSQINSRVIAAGESTDIFQPRLNGGEIMPYSVPGSDGDRFNKARGRIGVAICYCSTLNDCWTLTDGPDGDPTTTETRRCPAHSDTTFQQ